METMRMLEAVSGLKTRSHWESGVKAYAFDLLSNAVMDYNCSGFADLDQLHGILLNGAENWRQYSEGGCGLVYDRDIAGRLCAPSELRRTNNGLNPPDSSETWIDVETRALYQAWFMIIRTYNALMNEEHNSSTGKIKQSK